MSLRDLEPASTKSARATAINAFKRFVESEDVAYDYVHRCMQLDQTGTIFVGVVDKFGAYLAFLVSEKGALLARNTVTSYFRNVKLLLMVLYPACRNQSTTNMLKLGVVLERYCLKRDTGGMVVKATAATKDDLNTLIQFLYSTAVNPKDYHDACLLLLLWYCFGRASDLFGSVVAETAQFLHGATERHVPETDSCQDIGRTRVVDIPRQFSVYLPDSHVGCVVGNGYNARSIIIWLPTKVQSKGFATFGHGSIIDGHLGHCDILRRRRSLWYGHPWNQGDNVPRDNTPWEWWGDA
ncbi:hypothetical protein AaE_002530 [Aphanomyces astaci]|uniref:Uncharacterized protein n=1 Tax=Aphanomyces astaci TaxID=112090 RepID=A0A6A5AU10_APHAT|nr:hypothetical protein AaE_002530 [Aphanomyces astaci]